MLSHIISVIFLLAGTIFILTAAVGMLRMPDLFMRMSAATKAATFGTGLMLMGMAVYFFDLGITSRAIAIFVFVLATAPVSAHMIGRAAYSDGVPLWEGTQYDDLKGQYDAEQYILASNLPQDTIEEA